MPSLANIVIADAQATPVNHTFIPVGKDRNNVNWFEDQSAASAIGFWRITVKVVRPIPVAKGSSNERVYRVQVGLHQPILENVTNSTVSGIAPAPTLAYVCRATMEMVVPERASLQNRKDLAKMAPLLLQNVDIKSIMENLTDYVN